MSGLHVDRHVPLDGCLNLRDLGGYPTVDGRQVRWGCLFRSSELCSLTDSDLEVVTELGIRAVFDLRGDAERVRRPSRLPTDTVLHQRVSPSKRTHPIDPLEDLIARGTIPERDDDFLASVYIGQLDGGLVSEFRRILELAADAPSRPLLFHCAAGKDRTGLAAAILLGVLGVRDETILEDYELTTTYWAEPRLQALEPLLVRHDVAPARILPLLEGRGEVMRRSIEHVHDRWGPWDRYATVGLGLPADFPALLRSALITDPTTP